jgi:hypothetical protein
VAAAHFCQQTVAVVLEFTDDAGVSARLAQLGQQHGLQVDEGGGGRRHRATAASEVPFINIHAAGRPI